MKAYEFLSQLKKIDAIIRNKEIEIEQWKSIATCTTSYSEGERVQSSGNKQKMASAVDKYIDIESEINEYINSLIDRRKDIISVIQELPVVQYDLLHQVYVQYSTLAEVADIEGKSYNWAKSVHRKGLANVQKILDEREENENE